MLKTADWSNPQIGGFLTESIEKEDRHLAKTPPRYTVMNVWDPRDLSARPSPWKSVQARAQEPDAMHTARSKLGLVSPTLPTNGNSIPCRSNMLAARRTQDVLASMARDREADSQADHEAGFKSMASFFTPQDLQRLKPSYSQNETHATETTNAIVGLGAMKVPPSKSRFNRQMTNDFVAANNSPNRVSTERARAEAIQRSRPWVTPPPPQPYTEPTYASASPLSFYETFKRGEGSAFCVRPGEVRVV